MLDWLSDPTRMVRGRGNINGVHCNAAEIERQRTSETIRIGKLGCGPRLASRVRRSEEVGAVGTGEGDDVAGRDLRAGTTRSRFGETCSSSVLGLWDESCANARSRPLPHGHPEDRRSTATAPGAEWAVNGGGEKTPWVRAY